MSNYGAPSKNEESELSNDPPNLPSLYELIELQSADSALKEARRHAENGAEEGTLIWAHEQTDAHTRLNHTWHSPPGNLYCAVVLQPDFSPQQALEINYVTALSIGTALGSMMSPMVTLRYRWPNDIILNGDKAAGIFIDAPTAIDDYWPWMVIGVSVNVNSYPNDPNPGAVSVHEAQGNPEISVVDVLEEFSKQFLHWINRWAEHGFDPLLRNWRQRVNGIDEHVSIKLKNETASGILASIEPNGAAAITLTDGNIRQISLSEFYDLG